MINGLKWRSQLLKLRHPLSMVSMPTRLMRIHEYQLLELLQDRKVPIPLGNIAYSGKEAFYHARHIAKATDYQSEFVVKA